MSQNFHAETNSKPLPSTTTAFEQSACLGLRDSSATNFSNSVNRSNSTRRSWLKCIQLAFPELRILFGFLLICSALGTLWIQYRSQTADTLSSSWQAPVTLSCIAVLAFSPPLVFGFRSCQQQWRAISALLGLGWRNAVLLIALVCLIQSRAGEDFLLSSGLVACYFPLLALESWLLTRQAKRLCLDASLI